MKRLLTLLLCIVGNAHAGVEIQHWQTTQGAKVYFVASPTLPMLDIQIDLPVGSAHDPAGKAGVAALTYGLLDSGAGAMDEEEIADKVADLAIVIGGSADSDRTSITLRTLSDAPQLKGALSLLGTLLSQPSFPETVLKREKARSIAALEEAETRPDAQASRRFTAALYGSHPYGLQSTPASVAAITRDDLLAFHQSHYGAKGAVISLIGAISRSEAESIANQIAAALPAKTEPLTLPPVSAPAASIARIAHPSAQAHIFIGMPAVKRSDPDYYALLVGNYALGGGGFVSRLMKEVREKRGYAYSVYSYFAPKKLEGPFQIGLQTKVEQTDAALKTVNEVLDGYLKAGITETELKAAKQNIVDGLALRIDSNAKLLNYLSAIGFYDLPLNYIDDYPRLINSITAQQVRDAFANHVSKDHLVTVIVGGKGAN